MRFHWFLPTGGDDERLGARSHGVSIGGASTAGSVDGHREATLEYLTELAVTVEELGFEAVLTPTGGHCEDAWLVTAALIPATTRLKFLVAFRPGAVSPVTSAQMVSTFHRLSGGRVLLNVVVGGDDVEQRAYGDTLSKDQRYARADEFLGIARAVGDGAPVTSSGTYFTVDRPNGGGFAGQAPVRLPDVYFGGSSDAALRVAAEHADVYLTWGEPPDAVAEKLARVRSLAAEQGRTVRGGLRIHVITRETADEAWARAEELIADVDDATIATRHAQLSALGSEGQRRMSALHGGDRRALIVAPNLWAGIGLVRGGAGTALVGSHDQIVERLEEYRDAGVDEFILSGYPHIEEARHVGAVLSRIRSHEQKEFAS
ncbi:alkanesulfonate monooxygenase [Rhodococcus sp. Leaf7]|uniref:LLM class flavin-dependent oxidoreductase n=1 Tax=unclassified Rhodococcus (in: high G+C Gram-positive bacteria) TaxID=192944 RepID=UPI0006F89DFB|nr:MULTISPECIES: LLM class flavin-dependent oxidoreductase [unclassified Rhodococcus (in: high G+C Gram-positive bacteria)]KQU04336.1 alkanesulfonate monooxygenase [Rhodococcus sp. Leaf7]KQU40521.1 alkanesulfonate monooxygenase [Rhodococcus sp. Leaf247]